MRAETLHRCPGCWMENLPAEQPLCASCEGQRAWQQLLLEIDAVPRPVSAKESHDLLVGAFYAVVWTGAAFGTICLMVALWRML